MPDTWRIRYFVSKVRSAIIGVISSCKYSIVTLIVTLVTKSYDPLSRGLDIESSRSLVHLYIGEIGSGCVLCFE